jgi:hypothetical protein
MSENEELDPDTVYVIYNPDTGAVVAEGTPDELADAIDVLAAVEEVVDA